MVMETVRSCEDLNGGCDFEAYWSLTDYDIGISAVLAYLLLLGLVIRVAVGSSTSPSQRGEADESSLIRGVYHISDDRPSSWRTLVSFRSFRNLLGTLVLLAPLVVSLVKDDANMLLYYSNGTVSGLACSNPRQHVGVRGFIVISAAPLLLALIFGVYRREFLCSEKLVSYAGARAGTWVAVVAPLYVFLVNYFTWGPIMFGSSSNCLVWREAFEAVLCVLLTLNLASCLLAALRVTGKVDLVRGLRYDLPISSMGGLIASGYALAASIGEGVSFSSLVVLFGPLEVLEILYEEVGA